MDIFFFYPDYFSIITFSVSDQAGQQEGEARIRGQRGLRAAVRLRVAGVRLPPLQLSHQAQPGGRRRGRLLLRQRHCGLWWLRRSVYFFRQVFFECDFILCLIF